MSSMNFSSGDQWHQYQKQIQQSQEQEELTHRRANDPLAHLRLKEPTFVYSTALMFILKNSINEKWNDLFKQIDSSMINLAIQKSFKELQGLFTDLVHTDLSMEPSFLLHLSKVWTDIELSLKGLEAHPNASNLALRGFIHQLLGEITTCKKGQEFPLIHYLKEHAGTKWVPFPFMTILRTLHEEWKERPDSELKRWLLMINSILERAGGIEEVELG